MDEILQAWNAGKTLSVQIKIGRGCTAKVIQLDSKDELVVLQALGIIAL